MATDAQLILSGATDIADAVLNAMREPTKGMLDKGIDAIEEAVDWTRDSNETYIVTTSSDYALPGWQAMIDAAREGK